VAAVKWNVLSQDEGALGALREAGCPPILARLLVNRGAADAEGARGYLRGAAGLCDPMLLPDMDKAVPRIISAVKSGESMAVFGDYDVDGVTATAVLADCLEALGANFSVYIPDRAAEGYGLNEDNVKKLCAEGVKLIITVDTGISALKEAELAASLGAELIITDHHEPGQALPAAFAAVNPKIAGSKYPSRELSGAGVAFKLACALSQATEGGRVRPGWLELAALGTVADVVPLTGENRYIVKKGVALMRRSPLPGLGELLNAAGVRAADITATKLAFAAAPRLNAAGRMGSAQDAFTLLRAKSAEPAEPLARKLDSLNRLRQETEADIVGQACEKIKEAGEPGKILTVCGEGWHPGVIGIAASRLAEMYSRPAAVVAFEGETGRASCRSVPGFDIHAALSSCSGLLERFGGHALAAGFTVRRENYPAVCQALEKYARRHPAPEQELRLECALTPEETALDTAKECLALEPFGCGNPQPLFYIPCAQVLSVTPIKDGRHLKLAVKTGEKTFGAVFFGAQRAGVTAEPGDIYDLAVNLGCDSYQGTERLAVIVRALRPAAAFEKGRRLYLSRVCGAGEPVAPSRGDFANIFRCLRAHPQGAVRYSELLTSLGGAADEAAFARVLAVLDVFGDAGLIETERSGESVNFTINSGVRVDLGASEMLKRLSGEE
jgi:single-stranded-DNA-specific exonuclease